MQSISKLGLAVATAFVLGGSAIAFAQPAGTPKTSNPVPMDCARLTDQGAKADCVRAQERQRNTGQGQMQGTGVGKGQGQGAGVGQGSGQGATKGTGQLKKN